MNGYDFWARPHKRGGPRSCQLSVDLKLVPGPVYVAACRAAEREAELQALQKENEQLKSERTHNSRHV
jgi:hypothetical protein